LLTATDTLTDLNTDSLFTISITSTSSEWTQTHSTYSESSMIQSTEEDTQTQTQTDTSITNDQTSKFQSTDDYTEPTSYFISLNISQTSQSSSTFSDNNTITSTISDNTTTSTISNNTTVATILTSSEATTSNETIPTSQFPTVTNSTSISTTLSSTPTNENSTDETVTVSTAASNTSGQTYLSTTNPNTDSTSTTKKTGVLFGLDLWVLVLIGTVLLILAIIAICAFLFCCCRFKTINVYPVASRQRSNSYDLSYLLVENK
jgi:hypothetical protein